MRAAFQVNVLDMGLNFVDEATITVKRSDDGTLAGLWDADNDSGIDNPTKTDHDGWIRFYVDPGRYDIEADDGVDTGTIKDVTLAGDIIGDPTFDAMPTVEGDAIVSSGHVSGKGYYTKLSSGLLICRHHKFTVSQTSSFRLKATWTFPHSFASKDILITGSRPLRPNNTNVNVLGIFSTPYSDGSHTKSSASIMLDRLKVSGNNNFKSGDTYDVDVIAIGRWK